jgi:6-phosphogluconolactonase
MQPDIRILDDPATEAAARLATVTGHVVLTGGSTPKGAYEQVAAARPDWSGVDVWFTDERAVPPGDEFSNYKMIDAALLSRIEGATVHRMKGELGPDDGAADYAREYEEAGRPRFSLMLIGLGPDGHICSLFPSHEQLGERERPVVGVEMSGLAPYVGRITLTLPVVNATDEILVLVRGEDKAEAVAKAFAGTPDPRTPGSLLSPTSGNLTVLLDPAAASRLEAH